MGFPREVLITSRRFVSFSLHGDGERMQSRSRKSSRGVEGSGVMLGGDRCSILGGDREIGLRRSTYSISMLVKSRCRMVE